MIKKILIGLVVVIAGFAGFVATRPSDFKIERSTTIAAPAAVVFAQVNDLHKWPAWDPWSKMDPQAKSSYEGPNAGVGASHLWAGNMKVGEGKMTITESKPNDLIRLTLDFKKPFASVSTAEFMFKSQSDNETVVTWSMSGSQGFIPKAMCVFMNMEKMVGGNFEDGLAKLKEVSEQEARVAAEAAAKAAAEAELAAKAAAEAEAKAAQAAKAKATSKKKSKRK